MPGASVMHFKLIFSRPDGKILGAQAIGKGAADRRVDTIAALITMGGTLEDLKATHRSQASLENIFLELTETKE